MKRAIFAIILIVAIAMCVLWMRGRNGTAKPTEEKAEPSRISHDEKGRVIIKMDHQTQTNVGLVVAKAAAAKLRPELKGYGRVLDPAPLATLMAELASAKAAYSARVMTWPVSNCWPVRLMPPRAPCKQPKRRRCAIKSLFNRLRNI